MHLDVDVNPGTPPAITLQPNDSTICEGDSASFFVAANDASGYLWQVSDDGGSSWSNIIAAGSDPEYYQWTNPTIYLYGVVAANNGLQHRCIVNGGCPPDDTSSVATLAVDVPAAPTAGDASRCGDGTVTINATPGAGETIDWYDNASGGSYILQGNTSYTTSSIIAPGSQAKYAEARNATTGCVSAARTAVTATANTLPGAPSGTDGSRCGTGTVDISANPGPGNTTDWYAASTGGSPIAGGTGTNNLTTPSISSTTTYYAEARKTTTGCASATRTGVVATINPVPSISVHPTPSSQSVCAATGVTYDVTASGATSYQWRKDGNAISGATSSSLSFTAAASDAGVYDVDVINACGTVNSDDATLIVVSGYATANELYWDQRGSHNSVDFPCTGGTTWTWNATYNFYEGTVGGDACVLIPNLHINGTTPELKENTTGGQYGNYITKSNFFGYTGSGSGSPTVSANRFQFDEVANPCTNCASSPRDEFNRTNIFVSPLSAANYPITGLPATIRYCQVIDYSNSSGCNSTDPNSCVTLNGSALAYPTWSPGNGEYSAYGVSVGVGIGCTMVSSMELIAIETSPGSGTQISLNSTTTPCNTSPYCDYVSQQQLEPTAANKSYCVTAYGNGWRLPTDIEVGHNSDITATGNQNASDIAYGAGSSFSYASAYIWTSSKDKNINHQRYAFRVWTTSPGWFAEPVSDVNYSRCVFNGGY